MGPRANKMPYVFTNPHKDTELYLCDRVFVLSQKVLNNSKLSTKEVFENFMHATQTEKSHNTRRRANTGMGGSNGLDCQGVDVIREEFQDVSSSQRALERSMTTLSVDLSRKIEDMKRLMTGHAQQPVADEKKSRRMSNLIGNSVSAKNLLKAAVNKQLTGTTEMEMEMETWTWTWTLSPPAPVQ